MNGVHGNRCFPALGRLSRSEDGVDGVNEIDGALAEGAVPAMEASVIIRLGSVDVELIIRLLGEVDTWGKGASCSLRCTPSKSQS